jgi:hypothetical protein
VEAKDKEETSDTTAKSCLTSRKQELLPGNCTKKQERFSTTVVEYPENEVMRTSHLLIQPLNLQRNTYKDPSLELVPSNLTIRYFRFMELFLTYMRI